MRNNNNNKNNNEGRAMLVVLIVLAEITAERKMTLGRKQLRKIMNTVWDKLRCLPL